MSSLVAFKAKAHPQQDPRLEVDERYTPDVVFGPLMLEFGFTLDVCATPESAKCSRFFTREDDGLTKSWAGERAWCNPPYSAIAPWVRKALDEVRLDGCALAVLLLPANRTEQGWWQNMIEPVRDRGGLVRTRHLRGRINFGRPGNLGAKYFTSCPFGSLLVIVGGAP